MFAVINKLGLKYKILSLALGSFVLLSPVLIIFLVTLNLQTSVITDIKQKDLSYTEKLAIQLTRISNTHSKILNLLTSEEEVLDEEKIYENGSKLIDEMQLSSNELYKYVEIYKSYPKAKQLVGVIQKNLPLYKQAMISAVEMSTVDTQLSTRVLIEAKGHYIKYVSSVFELVKFSTHENKLKVGKLEKHASSSLNNLIIISIIAFAIISILAAVILPNIIRPIERLRNATKKLSDGNFSHQVSDQNRNDEIGDLARALEDFRTTSNYIVRLEDSKKDAEEQLRSDALTGLANRFVLQELSMAIGDRIRTSDQSISFLIIDINLFKPINDTFGHKAGDEVLKTVAERLLSFVGPHDIVCRIGADEFGIVIHDTASREEMEACCKRLMSVFEMPVTYEGKEISVTASMGGALGADVPGRLEDLISAADQTMRSTKTKSGGSYAIYDPSRMSAKPDLIAREEFEAALSKGQVVPYFQPKISLKDGALVGFEALARWVHPERGLLGPGAFFPMIEEYGMYHQFNNVILTSVLEQIQKWKLEGAQVLPVSINVDEESLASPEKLADIEDILVSYSDNLNLITLEITEDVFVAKAMETIRQGIKKFRDLGIKVSMDDFGTGYGSFKHLREFAFDELKIDMEFTSKIGKERSSEVIIEGFLSIAQGLNASVVAEGIETKEQEEFLINLGCNAGQGFLYSKAVSAEETAALLRTSAINSIAS